MLLLSITLGGQTFGLPGLNFPWKERRLGADDLRILLAPAQPIAMAPAPAPADISPTEVAKAVLTPVDKPVLANNVTSSTLIPPPAPAPAPEPVMTARKLTDMKLPIAADEAPARATPSGGEITVPSNAGNVAQKQIDQDTQERALEQVRLERERQSAERQRQAELMADAQREATRQAQLRQEAARAEQTARSEAARIEAERSELARQDGLRREALQKERARQDEKAQQEAARLEAERREFARQEQTRQAQLETARQAQLDAGRQDVARQEAARQERARPEQAQRERAEQEAKREERLRAIGKQLNEEAAQRDAASNRPSRTLLPTVSSLRRGWLLGRADPNTDLVLYAEAMSRKIEMNMTFDLVREAVKQPHAPPMVTVAIRADGSVEKVTFVVSSGMAAIDEAIRKVVASQAPYPAFTPALARQYDVIEIRRTWIFDIAIRLQ
jgi:hypothetical protein